TPVLDIKPYIPQIDAFAESRTGWLEQLPAALPVRWSSVAREKADWLRAQNVDVINPAERVLALGIDAQPRYKRVMLRDGSETDGELAVESWRVVFKQDDAGVEVVDIASGYTRAVVDRSASGETAPLHQDGVHRAFWQKWNGIGRGG
ncbi:MAG TPA: hypothetical protein VL860_10200, partial [Planctomycetota bacterium]|nr:hypothetical protein [Planctomycetota bacterium]